MLQGTPGSDVLLTTGDHAPIAASQASMARASTSGARTTSGVSIYDEWYQMSPRSTSSNNTPAPASSPGQNPETDSMGAKSLSDKSFFSSKNVSIFESLLEQKDLEKSTGKNNIKYVGIFSKNFKKTIQVDLNKLKGFIDNH